MNARPLQFRHGSCDSLGQRRRQEDYSAVWAPGDAGLDDATKPVLVVLADGMGGHVSGHAASRLACESYIASFTGSSEEIGPKMARALDVANQKLADAIVEDPQLKGMGCTLIGAYLDENGLRWVSVGDSTLLLYRNGSLHRLNADHSHGAILDRQAAAGIISRETAINDTRRRALYSALTGGPIQMRDLELNPHALYPGDWVIVASDGLLTMEGNDIASFLARNKNEDPVSVTRRLIQEVDGRNKPRQDNTTVVAVKIVGDKLAAGHEAEREIIPENLDDDEPTEPTRVGPSRSRRSRLDDVVSYFKAAWANKLA